jgi:hypothetical protein
MIMAITGMSVHEGVDHCREGETHHECDGEFDDVAPKEEVTELLEHGRPLSLDESGV